MAPSEGDREDFGVEDSQAIIDPLAQLAVELAICCLAIEAHEGGFCDYCTCVLKYHAPVEACDGECEFCGCYEQHLKPLPLLIPSPPMGRKHGGGTYYSPFVDRGDIIDKQDRAAEARKVLKELTE